jgi:protein O-GlcNAc transferase
VDYFIADPWTLPPDQEAHFSEQIWRLPETRLCFTPPVSEVDVGPLPALKNGYVTFGCFNNLSKMNDAVVALWAQVLDAPFRAAACFSSTSSSGKRPCGKALANALPITA